MGNIIKLDTHITNMIAAGEVIERVSSVVKELVENSIDANSSIINIALTDGGLKEIIVSDNGKGMDSYDARMALEPHATSKIKDEHDLFNIHTLGFRGEAIPSIVSVSQFKMRTNTEGGKGTMLALKDGNLLSQAVISHPVGTEISVKNLFYNTPARLATLKSESQELSWVIEYVSRMALACPNISFKLTNNDKLLLQTYGTNDRLEVINYIYGAEVCRDMIPFSNIEGNFKIFGYTSKISETRSNKNYINIIVNGRAIRNQKVINAVIEGYKTLLTVGRYPITVLEISVDPALVDVNSHPSKLEVRFSEEEKLIEMIKTTIYNALMRSNLVVDNSSASKNPPKEEINPFEDTEDEDNFLNEEESIEYEKIEEDPIDNGLFTFKDTPVYEEELEELSFEEETIDNNDNNIDAPKVIKEKFEQEEYDFITNEVSEAGKNRLPKLYYIGQLFGTYLLCQNEGEFFLIDQHAANERINYEKILKRLKEEDNLNFELLVPISLNFTSSEKIIIDEKMDLINKLGIYLDEFGGASYMVRRVPVWIIKGHEKDFVEEIINHIINNKKQEKYEFLDSVAKSLACKKSVKANDYLSKEEIEYLLEDLEKCEMPFTCPHGRPVIVKFDKYEIEKWFKRVQ